MTDEEELEILAEKYCDEIEQPFIDRFSEKSEEEFEPILRRIRPLVQNRETRQIIATGKSGFSLYDSIENDKIILFDFSDCYVSGLLSSLVCASLQYIDTALGDNSEPYVFFDAFQSNNRYKTSAISSTEQISYTVSIERLGDYKRDTKNMIETANNFISFKSAMDESELSTIALIHNVEPQDILHMVKNECFSKILTRSGHKSKDSVKLLSLYPVPTNQSLGIQEVAERTSRELGDSSTLDSLDEYGTSRFLDK